MEEKIGRRKVAMREARRRCGSGPREEAGEVRAARIRVEEEAGAGEGAPGGRGRRRARARYAGPDPQAICVEDCVEEEAGEGRAGRRSQEAGRKREERMSHQNNVPALVFLVVGDNHQYSERTILQLQFFIQERMMADIYNPVGLGAAHDTWPRDAPLDRTTS